MHRKLGACGNVACGDPASAHPDPIYFTLPETASPAAAAAAPAPELPPISALDIRVGRIVKCEPHPDAESLYVEQVGTG